MKKAKKLSPTFFLDPPIDLEHKQYVLLDWLQHVNKQFDSFNLYPELNELRYQLSNLESFSHSREIIINSLSRFNGVDLKKMEILYSLPEESSEMGELIEIVKWGIPRIKKTFARGSALFRQIEANITMDYVGIVPENYIKEGFLFIRQGGESLIHVYEYKIKDIVNPMENNKKMILHKVETVNMIIKDYESLKMKIINRSKECSNPNPVFLYIESNLSWPIKTAFLPVIQRIAAIKISKDYLTLSGKNDVFNGNFF